MAPEEWPQHVVQFTDWTDAEDIAVEWLLPALAAGVSSGDLAQWSFLRKFPSWRIRYQPTTRTFRRLDHTLDNLVSDGLVHRWTPGIYEPETTAFGGPAGMQVAHALFHHDSHHILECFARRRAMTSNTPELGRRELAILLISAAMRAAGLDWYEQGDVWAKVCAQRPSGERLLPDNRLAHAVHRLMTVDISPTSSPAGNGQLTHLADWISAFERAGHQLADLNHHGWLERGPRAVFAHHVIFHWNRLGLSREDQSTLSTLAKEVVMGTTHSAGPAREPATAAEVNSITGEPGSPTLLRTKLVDQLVSEGWLRTPRVEQAMRSVPRHLFVPDTPLEKAYGNAPVNTKLDHAGAAISCASQPNIVATMLEQLQVEPGQTILELGAGTGFNAGLLGHLVGARGHVITVDVDEDIVDGARSALAAADIDNVTVIRGDGALGYAQNAPYDRIVATVGAHAIPHAWLDQLTPGGRLLAPLRLRGSVSRSIAFERTDGFWRSVSSRMNTFMPLRSGIANDPRRIVPLTPDGTVTLVTNADQAVNTEALADVLTQPRTERWTGATFRGPESAEWLELWLTCTMPNGLSRMPAPREAIDNGLLTDPYPSSTAVFEEGALTYLTRRTATETAPDGATLYEFGVIGHGPGSDELVKRVTDAIGTWNNDYRHRDVIFEIHPLDAPPQTARPACFSFDNALNRIVIEWR